MRGGGARLRGAWVVGLGMAACLQIRIPLSTIRTYEGEDRPLTEVAKLAFTTISESDKHLMATVQRVDGRNWEEARKTFAAANRLEEGLPWEWELLPGLHCVEVGLHRESDPGQWVLEETRDLEFVAAAGQSYAPRVRDVGAALAAVTVEKDPETGSRTPTPRYR